MTGKLCVSGRDVTVESLTQETYPRRHRLRARPPAQDTSIRDVRAGPGVGRRLRPAPAFLPRPKRINLFYFVVRRGPTHGLPGTWRSCDAPPVRRTVVHNATAQSPASTSLRDPSPVGWRRPTPRRGRGAGLDAPQHQHARHRPRCVGCGVRVGTRMHRDGLPPPPTSEWAQTAPGSQRRAVPHQPSP